MALAFIFGILVLDSWFAISVHYGFAIILQRKPELSVLCCHVGVAAVHALCMRGSRGGGGRGSAYGGIWLL